MYVKRLNLYKKIGFSVIGWATPEKQQANAIYDAGNYSDTFEQDVIEADRAIVISSPVLLREKVNRFIYIVRSRQEAGVKITVITTNPDRVLDSSSNYYMELINTMTNNGINVIPREEFRIASAQLFDNALADNVIRKAAERLCTYNIRYAFFY